MHKTLILSLLFSMFAATLIPFLNFVQVITFPESTKAISFPGQ